MTQPSQSKPDPTDIAGRYLVVQKLGAGAFGTVYKAKDKLLGRMVAIKTIRLDGLAASSASLDELLKRFQREAQVSAVLKHQNIVTVYDIAEADGLTYLAMEFVDGVGLEKVISSAGRLPVDRAAAIGAQIADALDYAHRNGVVHRDIKPANVMIETGDHVKVTDFGIAKAIDSGEHLTVTGSLLGTPSYMSPEQARGASVDGRSDLFSVGCILYEMVAGKKAFRGDTITALIFKIITEEPQPLHQLEPGLPEPLLRIITKALSKAPEARYQSGRELAQDLLALSSGPPTLRQAQGATVVLPAPVGGASEATRLAGVTAVAPLPTHVGGPPTQVSPPTHAQAPRVAPPPLPQRAPGPNAAPPARRSGLAVVAVLGVLFIGMVLVGGGALWWFFSRTDSDQTTAQAGIDQATPETTTTPDGLTETPTPLDLGAATPEDFGAALPETTPSPSEIETPAPFVVPTPAPPRTPAPAATAPPPQTAKGDSSLDGDDSELSEEELTRRITDAFGAAVARRVQRLQTAALALRPGERPAAATLRRIVIAQEQYREKKGQYGSLTELTEARLLRLDVPVSDDSFQRRGYRFSLTFDPESFTARATPTTGGLRAFKAEESGRIRPTEGEEPDVDVGRIFREQRRRR